MDEAKGPVRFWHKGNRGADEMWEGSLSERAPNLALSKLGTEYRSHFMWPYHATVVINARSGHVTRAQILNPKTLRKARREKVQFVRVIAM